MNEMNHTRRRWAVWGGTLLLTLLAFYAMDLVVMAMQGLPLNWDLTPAQ